MTRSPRISFSFTMQMSIVERLWNQLTLWRMMSLLECAYAAGSCTSPQYVKLGTRAVISCAFPETFLGIYWYDHENVTRDDPPLISFVEGSKSGPGYDSEEYDIHPNGSLVINDVSVLHSHSYGVTIVGSFDRDPMFHPVSVVVFAYPVGQYPNIGCEDDKLCFEKVESPTSLNCSIDGVGDIIDDFSWELRSKSRNESISFQQVIFPSSGNGLNSYRVAVTVPVEESPALSLYVCSLKSAVPKVGTSEAAILVDHGTRKSNELSPILLEKPLNKSVAMEFGRGPVFSLTWQKEDDDEPIAYSVEATAGERKQKINRDGFKLEEDYSLTIDVVDERYVGVYICVYSEDGITTSYISYDVKIQEKGNEGLFAGIIVVIVIVVVILVVFIIAAVLLFAKRCKKTELGDQSHPEGLPMIKESGSSSKVITFKNENKAKHEETLGILEKTTGAQVKLENSFLSVDNGGAALHLTFGIVLRPNITIRRLDFDFASNQWRKFNNIEFRGILQFAASCASLEEVTFANSFLPFEIGDEIKGISSKKIEWVTIHLGVSLFLNYLTGKWEKFDGEVLTKNEHYKIEEDAKCSADGAN